MSDTLYQHQQTAAAWLAGEPRAALFDEQGLGKTVTAIVAADRAKARTLLVVAPSVVVWNWAREIERWSPWRNVQVLEAGSDTIDEAADAVIVTHGLILSERIREQLLARWWGAIVLDEAHFFRTPSAKRTQVFYGCWGVEGFPSLVSRGAFVWCLTGTPTPNNVAELWTMLWGLWPEVVPYGYEAFVQRFCKTVWSKYGDRIVGNKNVEELRKLLEGRTLRRKKTDVLDLPPVRHEVVTLTAPVSLTELRALEKALGPALREALAAEPNRGLELLRDEAFGRWRRLCGLAKAEACAELLAMELVDGGLPKVVVFAHHKDVVELLAERLQDFGVVTITGANSPEERQAAVQAFQNGTETRVAICNLVAGGTGTTLTAAADVVFVEMSFVPGENAQAADRVHRIGQTNPCRVRFLALAGTVDEPLVAVLRNKTRMIRELTQ
jgi:SNF2 family DNA or RNA helicase